MIFLRPCFLWLALVFLAAARPLAAADIAVSLAGNAYVTARPAGAAINDHGLTNWRDPASEISVYFRLQQPEKNVRLSLRARGHGQIQLQVGAGKHPLTLAHDALSDIPVGTFDFPQAGYQRIVISGKSKTGETFGEITTLQLSGIQGEVRHVRNFPNYWGRRGPSVHLGFSPPAGKDIEYFYNEIFVPPGEDVLQSYFMACGFADGYFGIQVNSPSERRVLFSVWSPFKTENPRDIPADLRITPLRRGTEVHVGEFGNEGSGGQSYLRYPWVAGQTYRFLLHARPDGQGNTVYTGYFFPPEEGKWRLIASFRRPRTDHWLHGPHSFLENFNPGMGWRSRRGEFRNQWVRDTSGQWHPLTQARFTCDDTGRAGVRLDYAGGTTPDRRGFFLQNCGFFDGTTPVDSQHSRQQDSSATSPAIDFSALEKLPSSQTKLAPQR